MKFKSFIFLIQIFFLLAQIISLNNERFTIPELLFNPSDIGIKEMGISEAIVDSIKSCYSGNMKYPVDDSFLTLCKTYRFRSIQL